MKRKNLLIFLLCAMPFSAIFAMEGLEIVEKIPSGRMERAKLPSEITSAGFPGRSDNTTEASLRGRPEALPDPGREPIGGGLGLLMLCAGTYLFNSKKNKK